MNLLTLPRDIIKHIIKYLSIKSCIALRSVSRRFRGYLQVILYNGEEINDNIFYICFMEYYYPISNFLTLSNNIRILKISTTYVLNKINIPKNLDTFIIDTLRYKFNDYKIFNVKNLKLGNLEYINLMKSEVINFSKLHKIKNISIDEIRLEFILPEYLNRLKIDVLIYNYNITIKYLECSYIKISAKSHINTIKIINCKRKFYLPSCDKLIISKKLMSYVDFLYNKPKIIEYI